MKSKETRNLKRHGSMTPSRNTRRYTLRSVQSSPGRSFLRIESMHMPLTSTLWVFVYAAKAAIGIRDFLNIENYRQTVILLETFAFYAWNLVPAIKWRNCPDSLYVDRCVNELNWRHITIMNARFNPTRVGVSILCEYSGTPMSQS